MYHECFRRMPHRSVSSWINAYCMVLTKIPVGRGEKITSFSYFHSIVLYKRARAVLITRTDLCNPLYRHCVCSMVFVKRTFCCNFSALIISFQIPQIDYMLIEFYRILHIVPEFLRLLVWPIWKVLMDRKPEWDLLCRWLSYDMKWKNPIHLATKYMESLRWVSALIKCPSQLHSIDCNFP